MLQQNNPAVPAPIGDEVDTSGHAAKRQRLAGHHSAAVAAGATTNTCCSSGSSLHRQLVEMLLYAFSGALQHKGGLEWRLCFVKLLQQARALHGALLGQLLGSMTGGHAAYDTKQVGPNRSVVGLDLDREQLSGVGQHQSTVGYVNRMDTWPYITDCM